MYPLNLKLSYWFYLYNTNLWRTILLCILLIWNCYLYVSFVQYTNLWHTILLCICSIWNCYTMGLQCVLLMLVKHKWKVFFVYTLHINVCVRAGDGVVFFTSLRIISLKMEKKIRKLWASKLVFLILCISLFCWDFFFLLVFFLFVKYHCHCIRISP